MKKFIMLVAMVAFFLPIGTPKLNVPIMPKIPNISKSVTLPEGAKRAAQEAGRNAVKNLNIKFDF